MTHSEQYSEEQKNQFQQAFHKRKKRRITVFIIAMSLLIGVFFTYPGFVLFGMPKHGLVTGLLSISTASLCRALPG